MLKFTAAALVVAFMAISVAAQAPTLTITQPDGPNLPSELWYGNIRVKPLRLRPGTTIPITLDDADFFVSQQYIDFLSRFADPAGLAFWMQRITQCGNDMTCIYNQRTVVSTEYFLSLEFQQSGYYVYRFYAGSLKRQPAYNEFQTDRRTVVGGGGLEPAKAAYAEAFVQRAEFLTEYPAGLNPTQFVQKVLDNLQAYDGTDLHANMATYVATVTNSGRGVGTRQIIDESLFQNNEFNKAFVMMQYYGYLRRGIDPNGYAFWLGILNNQGSDPNARYKMVCAFINSGEYQLRFSSTITQNDQGCGSVHP